MDNFINNTDNDIIDENDTIDENEFFDDTNTVNTYDISSQISLLSSITDQLMLINNIQQNQQNQENQFSDILNNCITNMTTNGNNNILYGASDSIIDSVMTSFIDSVDKIDNIDMDDRKKSDFANMFKNVGTVMQDIKNKENIDTNELFDNIQTNIADNINTDIVDNFDNFVDMSKKVLKNVLGSNSLFSSLPESIVDNIDFNDIMSKIMNIMDKKEDNQEEDYQEDNHTNDQELSPYLIEYVCNIYAKNNNVKLQQDNGEIDLYSSYMSLVETNGSDFSPHYVDETGNSSKFDDWADSIGLYDYIWDNMEDIENAIQHDDIKIEICI